MLENCLNKFFDLLTGIGYSFVIEHRASRENIESFTHEMAHLITLFGAKKTKEIILNSLATKEKISVSSLIREKLKTTKSQDNNEIKTTAITILATERLGGGTFQESMSSMVGNLQAKDSEVKRQDYINQCVKLMMDPKIQGQANILAKMLLDIEKDLLAT